MELPDRTARPAPRRRQMIMSISSFASKVIGDKKRWRQYKARKEQLPANYRTAIDGVERYLMYFGRGDGPSWASMLEDLADLFEQSAANGTPIREIVGEDPVEFVEAFIQNYPEGQWRIRERERLTNAIERAAGEDTGKEDTSG
jgi:DNA-binding ferritin-like protein (Dps family)